MKTITPLKLDSQLKAGNFTPVLLDVREPREYEYCRIAGSINIPMHDVPSRLNELDKQRDIIVICHHGMRSASVVELLEHFKFPSVTNLTGGVAAWAEQVEPAMPRY